MQTITQPCCEHDTFLTAVHWNYALARAAPLLLAGSSIPNFFHLGTSSRDAPRNPHRLIHTTMSSHVLLALSFVLCTLLTGSVASTVSSDLIQLDDATFEHLTQASTGQTTGIW